MKYSISDFDPIFKRIPQLRGMNSRDFQIRLLPGYTNQNIHLKNSQDDWVLRIPKVETNQYINRQFEAHNAAIAAGLDIAPNCVWRDDSGLSLSMTLKNTRSMTPADLHDESTAGVLIKILKQLHGSGCKFRGRADLAGLLNRYYALVSTHQQEDIKNTRSMTPADLHDESTAGVLIKILKQLHGSGCKFRGRVDLAGLLNRYYALVSTHQQEDIKNIHARAQIKLENLSDDDTELVPSHNDLVLENILIGDTGRIWIIDWEFASMASPWWDLATLCNASELSRDESASLLAIYQGEVSKTALRLLADYRYVLQVLSICWMAAFTETSIGRQIEKLSNNPEYP